MSNLRKLIKKRYNMEEAAAALGYASRSGLYYLLNNPGSISLDKISDISQALEIPKKTIREAVEKDRLEAI